MAQPRSFVFAKTDGVDDTLAKDFTTASAETALGNLMTPREDTTTDGKTHQTRTRQFWRRT